MDNFGSGRRSLQFISNSVKEWCKQNYKVPINGDDEKSISAKKSNIR